MITIILGGSEDGPGMRDLKLELSKFAKTLNAESKGAFLEFCRRVIDSVQLLEIADDSWGERTRKVANDDFNVFFSSAYLARTAQEGTVLLKIATAIEVALDLGLNVQALALDKGVVDVLEPQWPEHWPKLRLFTAREQA
ncbi:MAG: hypothetical protein ACE5D3_07390 [Candidatus Binatia bacterium]